MGDAQVESAARTAPKPAEEDDHALIALVAAGDRAAFGRLYDRYSSLLMAVGQRVLGDRRRAEDLLHDVFLEVWRRADTYDAKRGSLKVWLCMRMRSRALDRIRSAARGHAVPIEEAKRPEAEQSTGQDASMAADRIAVRKALESLPPEQRTVLELGYYQGMSSSEIARHTDIPIGTVKSRVAAGLSKLRSVLGDGPGGAS